MVKQRKENLILMSAAALSGLLAALLAHAYLGRAESPPLDQGAAATPLRSVVIVTRNIARGEALQVSDMTVIRIPATPGATPPLGRPDTALGRVALQPLYAGEWLLEQKLSLGQVKGRGVIGLLNEGRRGMRIPADRVSGLLGVLQPGDHVDVIAVIPQGDGQGMLSRTLLQNVTVLAIGRMVAVPGAGEEEGDSRMLDEDLSSITLDVSPEQAEAVALALQAGKLQLVVRNGADTAPVATRGADLLNLFGAVLPVDAASQHRIEILVGEESRTEVVKP